VHKAPAGWYTDTAGSGSERWFDGVGWTELTRPREPADPARTTRWAVLVAVVVVVATPLLLPLLAG